MERDLEYENNNIGFDWQYSKNTGGGIKCKNYEICGTILSKRWFEYKGNYLCTKCHMMFGTWKNKAGKGILKIIDNVKCSICFETKRSIEQPNCDRTICIDCFKRYYHGYKDTEPEFPYPDIEDEYYENEDSQRWIIGYPLIKKYNKEWNSWFERQQKREEEKYLQNCSICRS